MKNIRFALISVLLLSMVPGQVSSTTDLSEIFRRIKPSVVFIVSAMQDGAQSGSGFIFASNSTSSEVVTANHVIEGATAVDVILDNDTAKKYRAEVVSRDHVRDVAFLRIQVGKRVALPMMQVDSIEEGMRIAVVGYPRATFRFKSLQGDALRPTIHTGIVSAIRLSGDIIQIDAATDHGDSGGPVIDEASGEVLGLIRGAELDPAYAARGLEMPLPGSAFAMSTKVIQAVLSGAPSEVTASSPSSQDSSGLPNSAAGPQSEGRSPGSETAKASPETSSAYRVGYIVPQYTSSQAQILSPIFDHLISALTTDNGFYMVQQQGSAFSGETSAQLFGNCQDERVNALMSPLVSYSLSGGQTYNAYGTYYTGKAQVTVALTVLDCAAEPFYRVVKTKSENRMFANRPPEREIPDMANDLVDQAASDFATFRASHAAQWDSLLKTGLAVDPQDQTFHHLFYMLRLANGNWQVAAVMPGGPADRAGLKKQDVVQSVNGTSIHGVDYDKFKSQLEVKTISLAIQRPGTTTTISIDGSTYSELLKMIGH